MSFLPDAGTDGPGRWSGAAAAGFAVLLCMAALYYASLLNTYPPEADGAQNLRYAYNLYKFGIFSSSRDEVRTEVVADSRREPFYPFLLSGWMQLSNLDAGEVTKQCLLDNSDECAGVRRWLMWPNVVFMVLVVGLTGYAALRLSGSALLALAAAALVSVNDLLYHGLQRHHTEILAALLLLLHALALWALMARPDRLGMALLAGLAAGLLVLTKAAFYYWLMLLVPATVLVWLWRGSRAGGSWLVMVVAALLLVVPWQIRNDLVTGDATISGRGNEVLAIRAEFGDISRQEFNAALVYYNPFLERHYLDLYPPEAYTRLGYGEDSFHDKGKTLSGIVGERAAARPDGSAMLAAAGFIAEKWRTQIALTGLLFYRGFISAGKDLQSLVAATLPSIGFVIASIYIAVRRRELAWFILPAWFALGFFSTLTHFIPRYSAPLYPLVTVAFLAAMSPFSRPREPDSDMDTATGTGGSRGR